jgi:hypothetical protein
MDAAMSLIPKRHLQLSHASPKISFHGAMIWRSR